MVARPFREAKGALNGVRNAIKRGMPAPESSPLPRWERARVRVTYAARHAGDLVCTMGNLTKQPLFQYVVN